MPPMGSSLSVACGGRPPSLDAEQGAHEASEAGGGALANEEAAGAAAEPAKPEEAAEEPPPKPAESTEEEEEEEEEAEEEEAAGGVEEEEEAAGAVEVVEVPAEPVEEEREEEEEEAVVEPAELPAFERLDEVDLGSSNLVIEPEEEPEAAAEPLEEPEVEAAAAAEPLEEPEAEAEAEPQEQHEEEEQQEQQQQPEHAESKEEGGDERPSSGRVVRRRSITSSELLAGTGASGAAAKRPDSARGLAAYYARAREEEEEEEEEEEDDDDGAEEKEPAADADAVDAATDSDSDSDGPLADDDDTSDVAAPPQSGALRPKLTVDMNMEPLSPREELKMPEQPETPPAQTEAEKRRRKRRRVAMELLSTEETFVLQLELCIELYLLPLLEPGLSSDPQWLSKEEIDTLFGNMQTLVQLNRNFLTDLRDRLLDTPGRPDLTEEENMRMRLGHVGDLVLSFAPFFKLYSLFVANHEDASNLLSRTILKNPKRYAAANEHLERAAADPRCNGQTLHSFFILPIQRVPRYKLLVEQLLKYSRPGEAELAAAADDGDQDGDQDERDPPEVAEAEARELEALTEALDSIKVTATHINETMRTQERNREVLRVQDQFAGNVSFVAPGRRFVRSGKLTKIGRKNTSDYVFFLFSDMLAYAEDKTLVKGYRLRQEMIINEAFSAQALASDAVNGGADNGIEIVSFEKSFVVLAADAEERDGWLRDIAAVVEESQSRVRRPVADSDAAWVGAPIFEQFSSKSTCSVCQERCSLLNRRHCRSCGKVVHSGCSETRMILPGTHDKSKKRVCDTCSDRIREERTRQLGRERANSMPGLTDEQKAALASVAAPPVPRRHSRTSSLPPERPERPPTLDLAAARALTELRQRQSVESREAAEDVHEEEEEAEAAAAAVGAAAAADEDEEEEEAPEDEERKDGVEVDDEAELEAMAEAAAREAEAIEREEAERAAAGAGAEGGPDEAEVLEAAVLLDDEDFEAAAASKAAEEEKALEAAVLLDEEDFEAAAAPGRPAAHTRKGSVADLVSRFSAAPGEAAAEAADATARAAGEVSEAAQRLAKRVSVTSASAPPPGLMAELAAKLGNGAAAE